MNNKFSSSCRINVNDIGVFYIQFIKNEKMPVKYCIIAKRKYARRFINVIHNKYRQLIFIPKLKKAALFTLNKTILNVLKKKD